ncbi:hypothetical protein CoNPh11_CDS0182 [Staphylococcus phage S-CoN_Ph11]|nr:hypothetical protein CoNPh11_CDS0182 [Staphylococcus phage S-CoN_Ph11]
MSKLKDMTVINLNEIADFEVNRAMDLWENNNIKIRRGCMEFELKESITGDLIDDILLREWS